MFFVYKKKCDIITKVKGGIPVKEKLTKEEVLHVAHLARIKVDEEEIEKYQVELKQLLNDVDKIKEVEGYDEERMIAPWSKNTITREDKPGEMLNPKEVLKNAPRHSGNYIEVPIVISESEGV